MKLDTPSKFSPTTIALHWIVGLTMIGLLAVGVYMAETETYFLYQWHKSFGVAIFAVILLRVVWRLKNGWPTPVSQYKKWEHTLAKIVHWTLIIGTLLMPISGFLMSAVGGHGVDFFGIELVARNANPENAREALPHNETIAGLAHEIHEYAGFAIIGALVLHIAGAIKHHAVDKDATLRRMLGKN